MKRFIGLGIVDLGLLVLAFGLVHLLNYGHLSISGTSYSILQLQILVWLVLSLAGNKFSLIPNLSYIMGASLVLKIGAGILFLLSLIIVGLQLMHFSRTMAYGTIFLFLFLELAVLALYHWIRGPVPYPVRYPVKSPPVRLSHSLVIVDGLMLLAAFFLVTYFKRGSLTLFHPYDDILFIYFGMWLGFSLFTRKFNRENFSVFLSAFGPALKTVLSMAAGLAFFIYLFRLEPVSRLQVFAPLALLLAMECLVFFLYVTYRRHGLMIRDLEDREEVNVYFDQRSNLPRIKPAEETRVKEPAGEKLKHTLDFFDPRIYELISSRVDLRKLDRSDCALLSTDNRFNLEVLENGRMGLIINLHKINDVRWFNRYFLLAHEKLRPWGCLVGKAHTISTHRDYYQSKFPKHLNTLFYSLSFIWGRVFPKLPGLKKFYFAVTKGRNRMVSRAEVLGRLCFCGYRILAEEEIGYRFFFVAQKIKRPSMDPDPTYGPLVGLRRTGLGGQPITVYKFRTMYPFSEYLQEYVYQKYRLDKGGKFKNDFRVTGWGRFMRRTWLDELPMLYNWLRGDLRLVGVRPLSSQYLDLYTPDLRELRQKVKPGLLPPFYADLPETLEEIMESEKRYIESYLKHPGRTQVRYFFRCVWNIVVRRARSG